MKKLLMVCLASLCLATSAFALNINEFCANDVSTDDQEFIELTGDPGMSLNGYSIVLIEGEGTGKGVVDKIISLSGYTMPADGYFVIGDALTTPDLTQTAGFIENGGNNIILFQGTLAVVVGNDIDTDDDCVADVELGTGTVVDGVGYGYNSADDCCTYYGIPAVGPDVTYDPAAAGLCCGVWEMICLNHTEIPGLDCTGTGVYGITYVSPGAANLCVNPSAVEPSTWGGVKSMYK
jgi:hypothetical protein